MMTPPATPVTTGTIPFTHGGETFETFYKLFGTLEGRTRRPLVVLHGGPGLVHDYLAPFGDLAAAGVPVLLYDQLGNGRSTHLRGKPAAFWSIALFVAELRNVLAHFGVAGDFDLAGHSWGGIVAAELAVARPAGLRHLVLTDSLAAFALWMQSNMQLMATFPEDVQKGLMAGMAQPKEYYDALRVFHRSYGCTLDPPPQEYIYTLDAVFGEGGDATVASALLPELMPWTIVDRLHNIAVPTLVINGAKDIAQDFVVAPFFQNIPKAKWITFANSSHTPFWEERDLYMKRVGDFLEL
ncbi:proline-specific peptidase [Phanerochaete sordida]|uniref:Proline-specific peptidase n=1 Tax=Phanerochaete sordida TaxID=48140 RepID=A0A9P3GGI0_9APHY|nr:proline-specific peptidase [Phanerochaete sordida]